MLRPHFFSQPVRYVRWAAHEYPAVFFSVLVGALGPVALVTVPSVRRALGDDFPSRVPRSYPIPTGPRKIPEGYDDE